MWIVWHLDFFSEILITNGAFWINLSHQLRAKISQIFSNIFHSSPATYFILVGSYWKKGGGVRSKKKGGSGPPGPPPPPLDPPLIPVRTCELRAASCALRAASCEEEGFVWITRSLDPRYSGRRSQLACRISQFIISQVAGCSTQGAARRSKILLYF